MRDVIAAFCGALMGSAFSLISALAYVAAVRRVGRKVFRSWLLFLWLPVHFIFAFTLSAPMFFPFFAIRFVGASFPLTNALYALAISFGILGAVPPFTYFFRQWRHLEHAGYFLHQTGLTKR
jgi:hypothetical protein